tara:strand:+ start:137 stop:868 length:732 start_codon:yes stop_codon:yes gene_type:complete
MNKININVDMGEGFNIEEKLMPLINSCNISCGAHAGGTSEIKRVVGLAKINAVKIGAHPSYPDRKNFGRISMKISRSELIKSIKNQLLVFVQQLDHPKDLNHIKPHGALYNDCVKNKNIAQIIVEIVEKYYPEVLIFTIHNGELYKLALSRGLNVYSEAFLDRGYKDNGQLEDRAKKGAILRDGTSMYNQLYNILEKKQLKTVNGKWINITADTFCIHGDHKNVLENLVLLHQLYKNYLKKGD